MRTSKSSLSEVCKINVVAISDQASREQLIVDVQRGGSEVIRFDHDEPQLRGKKEMARKYAYIIDLIFDFTVSCFLFKAAVDTNTR